MIERPPVMLVTGRKVYACCGGFSLWKLLSATHIFFKKCCLYATLLFSLHRKTAKDEFLWTHYSEKVKGCLPLRFYHGLSFPRWTLEDILAHPYDLWQEVTSKCRPVALFKEYLENPNIIYALTPTKVDIGTLRETFAIGSLAESHNVEYGKAQGDFKVDGKYTFEIGGRSKDFSQIAGVKDSYVFADDWDMPDGAKLPLWMLGFLY